MTFTIRPADGSDTPEPFDGRITILPIPNQSYTGEEIIPTVVVQYTNSGGKTITLTKGKDYEVAYTNNSNMSTAFVTVTSKGNYTGYEATKTFQIVATLIHLDVAADPERMEVDKGNPTIHVAQNSSALSDDVYTLTYVLNGQKVNAI